MHVISTKVLSATFPTSPNTENLNMFFALLLQLNLTGINKVIASNHNIVDYTMYDSDYKYGDKLFNKMYLLVINFVIKWDEDHKNHKNK